MIRILNGRRNKTEYTIDREHVVKSVNKEVILLK
jgi:hypothetical protein